MDNDYGTYIMAGLYNNAAKAGPITGSGPNYAQAMAKFKERQYQLSKPGIWRSCNKTSWKKRNGKYIDRDWDIISI